MATRIKTSRIAWISLAIAVAIGCLFALISAAHRPTVVPIAADTCQPVPLNLKFFSKALTVAQIEKASLEEIAKSPDAPQVPFGHMNGEWLALKRNLRAGDTIHSFESEITAGHLVLRDGCVTDELNSWIR